MTKPKVPKPKTEHPHRPGETAVSLAPLDPDEAVADLLKVKPGTQKKANPSKSRK